MRYARKFGITSDLKPYMSLSLGAFEVTLKEMVEAFTVFANYGVRVNSYFIRSIRDLNNNIIEENFPERKQVIEKETAFIMNYLLQGVVRSGTGWRARALPAPMGGKTGTTNDFTDAWFIGFTPSLTVGVWVGLDQKKSLGDEQTGSEAAAPIFVKFMENYLAKYPETGKFRPPSGRLHDRHRQVHRQAGDPRLPVPASARPSCRGPSPSNSATKKSTRRSTIITRRKRRARTIEPRRRSGRRIYFLTRKYPSSHSPAW